MSKILKKSGRDAANNSIVDVDIDVLVNKKGGDSELVLSEIVSVPLATSPRTLTIDAAADVITDLTAPLAAEIITVDNFPAGTKFATVTYHYEEGGIPFTPVVMVSLNASDIGTAIQRFTVSNIGAGGTSNTDEGQPAVSAQKAVLELNTFGTDATIDTIHLGAFPATGLGANPVYITIEVQ